MKDEQIKSMREYLKKNPLCARHCISEIDGMLEDLLIAREQLRRIDPRKKPDKQLNLKALDDLLR